MRKLRGDLAPIPSFVRFPSWEHAAELPPAVASEPAVASLRDSNFNRAAIAILGAAIACSLLTTHHQTPWGQAVGEFIAHQVNYVFILTGALLVLAPPAISRVRATYWWLGDLVLCNTIIVDGLCKQFVHLGRPGSPTHNGFPSGHAAFAFGLAYLVSRKYPRLAPFFYTIAVSIAWARVEVSAHFTYQALGGALIGTLLGWGITRGDTGILLPRALSWARIPKQGNRQYSHDDFDAHGPMGASSLSKR